MYKVGRVVIGENSTFVGGEAYLKQRGIEVVLLDNAECKALMQEFIEKYPRVWLVFHILAFACLKHLRAYPSSKSSLHAQCPMGHC